MNNERIKRILDEARTLVDAGKAHEAQQKLEQLSDRELELALEQLAMVALRHFIK